MHAAICVMTILAAVIRFYSLGKQSVWYDEANGIRIASKSLRQLFIELQADASPPLYYLILKVWIELFGTGEAATRAFSALCGTLAIPAIYALGKRLFRSPAALVAAGILCVSQMHVYYSQEARMYALLVLLVVLMIFCLYRAVETASRRDWCVYGVITTAVALTHNYGLFAIAGTVPYLFFVVRSSRRQRQNALLALVVIGILYLPWFPFALKNQLGGTAIQGDWLPPFSPSMVVQSYVRMTSMYMFTPGVPLFWLGHGAYLGCIAIAMARVCRIRKNNLASAVKGPEAAAVLICIVVLSIGIPMLISIVRPIYLPHRYSIIALPAVILLMAYGISEAPTNWLRGPIAAGILLASLSGLFWHFSYMQKSRDRDLAMFFREQFRPRDVAVFSPHWVAVSMDYYLPDLANQIGFPMKTLRERKEQNEAFERERRLPQDVLELTRRKLLTPDARIILLRMTWLDESRFLQDLYDKTFCLKKRFPVDRYELSIYTQHQQPDKE